MTSVNGMSSMRGLVVSVKCKTCIIGLEADCVNASVFTRRDGYRCQNVIPYIYGQCRTSELSKRYSFDEDGDF